MVLIIGNDISIQQSVCTLEGSADMISSVTVGISPSTPLHVQVERMVHILRMVSLKSRKMALTSEPKVRAR